MCAPRIEFRVHSRAAQFGALMSIAALTFASALAGAPSAQTRESRPANSYATAIGVPLNTIIVFGDQYNGGDELYDVRITVAEVVRGEKAWQMVKAASGANVAPSPGRPAIEVPEPGGSPKPLASVLRRRTY